MKIYLASPYTHEDPAIMELRFKTVCKLAGSIMRKGHLVFCPIAHTHPIAVVCELPRGFDFWEAYDRTFVEWCDQVWVACMSGWKESKGVQSEIRYALLIGKEVQYLSSKEEAP